MPVADRQLERLTAGMLCIGFEGTSGVSPHLRSMIARGVRNFVLMGRNVERSSVAEVAELCAALRRTAIEFEPDGDDRVMICIDQEGGRVQRARGHGFSVIPAMREIGATGDAQLARAVGEQLGKELRAAGINMNLAPVLDVDTNPANPVIGSRSLSSDPEMVARLGCAFIEGLQSQGVAACAKHFPGHGDTSIDSHLDLPRLSHALDRVRSVELAPFRAAVPIVAAIMSAHILFERIDPLRPATLSPVVLRDLLRNELGFTGLCVSDDMEMKAMTRHFAIDEAFVGGTTVGIDLFLVCNDFTLQERALDALSHAAHAGAVPLSRLQDAAARRRALCERCVHAGSRKTKIP